MHADWSSGTKRLQRHERWQTALRRTWGAPVYTSTQLVIVYEAIHAPSSLSSGVQQPKPHPLLRIYETASPSEWKISDC